MAPTCSKEMADRLCYVSQDMHWLQVPLPAGLAASGALGCANALPFNLPDDAFAAQCSVRSVPHLVSVLMPSRLSAARSLLIGVIPALG